MFLAPKISTQIEVIQGHIFFSQNAMTHNVNLGFIKFSLIFLCLYVLAFLHTLVSIFKVNYSRSCCPFLGNMQYNILYCCSLLPRCLRKSLDIRTHKKRRNGVATQIILIPRKGRAADLLIRKGFNFRYPLSDACYPGYIKQLNPFNASNVKTHYKWSTQMAHGTERVKAKLVQITYLE